VPASFQCRSYWGYSFESLVTESKMPEATTPKGAQDGDSFGAEHGAAPAKAPVDANVEYCTILRTKLGAHRIIMGAEIDCYDRGSDGKKRYVELKTSKVLVNENSVRSFEKHKLLSFWVRGLAAAYSLSRPFVWKEKRRCFLLPKRTDSGSAT
jgi:RAT1-interacting protein